MDPNRPHLKVRFSPAGVVINEAVNCEGTSCVEASAPIEIALGGVDSRDLKPEYYAPPAGAVIGTTVKQDF